MVAFIEVDTFRIFNEKLEPHQKIYLPEGGDIVVLSDNTYLVAKTIVETELIDTLGITAYWEIGRDDNCDVRFMWVNNPWYSYTYNTMTELIRYDLQGAKLFETSFEGFFVRSSVIEHQNHLFIALPEKERTHWHLDIDPDGFMRSDTIRMNSEGGKLNLHKLNYEGDVVWSRVINGFIDYDLSIYYNSYFSKSTGNFWLNTRYGMAQIDFNGNLIRKYKYPKAQCAEVFRMAMGTERGVLVNSQVLGENKVYIFDQSGDVSDINFSGNQRHPFASEGNTIFFAGSHGISSYDGSWKTIWQKASSPYTLLPNSVRRACDGSFFCIASGENGKNYLLKITSAGEVL